MKKKKERRKKLFNKGPLLKIKEQCIDLEIFKIQTRPASKT